MRSFTIVRPRPVCVGFTIVRPISGNDDGFTIIQPRPIVTER